MMKSKSGKVNMLTLPKLPGKGKTSKASSSSSSTSADLLHVFDLRRVRSCETRMDRRFSTESTLSFRSAEVGI